MIIVICHNIVDEYNDSLVFITITFVKNIFQNNSQEVDICIYNTRTLTYDDSRVTKLQNCSQKSFDLHNTR